MLSLHPATEVFQNGGSLKIAEGCWGSLLLLISHVTAKDSLGLKCLPRPPQKSRK